MTTDSSNLDSVARIAHKVALGLIALCALAIFLGPAEEAPPFDRTYTVWGVGTALGAVICRRFGTSPVIRRRSAILLSLGGFAFCVALATVGLLLARGPDPGVEARRRARHELLEEKTRFDETMRFFIRDRNLIVRVVLDRRTPSFSSY